MAELNMTSMEYIIRILVSLAPVIVFLSFLVVLDSYKLLNLRTVLGAISIGVLAALSAALVNEWVMQKFDIQFLFYTKYIAPWIEEMLKGVFIVYLIKSGRIGFMVDAAIAGIAIGAGFGIIENIYYLQFSTDTNLSVWIIRGFGTAVMHGGTSATFSIISKVLSDRKSSVNISVFLLGFTIAVLLHSFYNQFFFSPVIYTVILLVTLPIILNQVFTRSEKSLQKWLGVGFDTDMELLELIKKGKISDSRVGKYLQPIKEKFSPEVVFDMICYLRIHLELSIRAKGVLMMREIGHSMEPDPEIKDKFRELRYLEKNIGKTAQLAISPFLHKTRRDLWQLHVLGN